ncbi:MAG: permease [Agarilytica sp.]
MIIGAKFLIIQRCYVSDCCHKKSRPDLEVETSATGECGDRTGAAPASSEGHCCAPVRPAEEEGTGGCCETKARFDYLLWGPFTTVVLLYAAHLLPLSLPSVVAHLSMSVFTMMNTMAWGLVIGIFMVAVLSYVPRELVISAMGAKGGVGGICRATAAGVLLDLCSHGILMVGAKLYERGVSVGQVMAFLIASPWNSFSLTIILIAFIGLPWTLLFIALSVGVAIVTGLMFDLLVKRQVLPANPHAEALPEGFRFWPGLKAECMAIKFSWAGLKNFILTGLSESKMVIRWLLIGVVLAALIQVFVNDGVFGTYFGPTMLGLMLTMVAATIIEVCSEGATPIAADLFHRASAPGNSFAFLMAGVSTDYTEIAVLKQRTRSWKIALFLPLLTLPQIMMIAYIVNVMAR